MAHHILCVSQTLGIEPSGPAAAAVELVEGQLRAGAFSPHRHATYAVAVTTIGVQAFNYRGVRRRSLPGQVVVLHPDELHDGYCCDDIGFAYRAAYLPPAHIQTVIGGAALPFLAEGVSTDPCLVSAARSLISVCATDPTTFGYQDALHRLVSVMQRIDGATRPRQTTNRDAVMRVRDYLDSLPGPGTNLDQLEKIAGYNRWQLSRDFRSLLGTSPYRYLQFRRLEEARRLLRGGLGLAAAAHEAGFADQSHFGRIFRAAYGAAPSAWHQSQRHRTIIL